MLNRLEISVALVAEQLKANLRDAFKERPREGSKKELLFDLVYELESDESSVKNWMAGRNIPRGNDLLALFDYFHDQGDHDFEREVRGYLPGENGNTEAQARIQEARGHLQLGLAALDAPAKVTRLEPVRGTGK